MILYLRVRNYRTGYDLDFYMSPQALFGANIDINITNLETRIQDVIVGGNTYTYQDSKREQHLCWGYMEAFILS